MRDGTPELAALSATVCDAQAVVVATQEGAAWQACAQLSAHCDPSVNEALRSCPGPAALNAAMVRIVQHMPSQRCLAAGLVRALHGLCASPGPHPRHHGALPAAHSVAAQTLAALGAQVNAQAALMRVVTLVPEQDAMKGKLENYPQWIQNDEPLWRGVWP